MASRSPGTPTEKQSALEASVARALENMERKMSMLEPPLKDLKELKGRSLSLAIEVEEHKKNLQFLIEERKKGGSDGEVV
eukprot:6192935-Prorocentrum_lima.AAC.1